MWWSLPWWKNLNFMKLVLVSHTVSLSEFILLVSMKGLSLHNSFLSKHFIFRKWVFRFFLLFFVTFFFTSGDPADWPQLKAMLPQRNYFLHTGMLREPTFQLSLCKWTKGHVLLLFHNNHKTAMTISQHTMLKQRGHPPFKTAARKIKVM